MTVNLAYPVARAEAVDAQLAVHPSDCSSGDLILRVYDHGQSERVER